jgi:3-(3-hydroxy-phenyl)propionate hydroxylase
VIAEQRFERIGPFVYPHFHPALPLLRDGRDTQHHKVAIVGGGPVGVAVALGLARYGVASVIIEADDSVCMGSRSACVSRRSLEIMERLGALQDFMAKGLPWTDGRSFYVETEVFRFSMPHDAQQKLPPMISLQQYYIEQFLVDAVARVNRDTPGLIEIRLASQVDGLQITGASVVLDVANVLGRYRLEADWVVACDGTSGGGSLGADHQGKSHHVGLRGETSRPPPQPSPASQGREFVPSPACGGGLGRGPNDH